MNTNTNTITARQYFQTVLDAHLSEDMDKLSVKYIAGLDARNEKRKSADSKEKQAARARAESVLKFLSEHSGEQFTRDAIAEAIGITAGQVTAACKALGESITKGEAKVDKTKRVVYSVAG